MSRKNPREIDREIMRLLSVDRKAFESPSTDGGLQDALASDSLIFLAKLNLLAMGDRRQDDLLPEPKQTRSKQVFSFDAKLPVMLYQIMCVWARSDAPVSFNLGEWRETDTGNPDTARYVLVPALVDCCRVLQSANIGAMGDGFRRKRIAAAGLLETMAAICTIPEYEANPKTLAIQRSDKTNAISAFLGYMADGMLIACPHCGWPVFLPRETSSPFCKKSHQVRYYEKAQRMLKNGASVDEVAAKYDRIGRGTISSWLNW